MKDTLRERIRDTAMYLRQVRPVDPDEIHEYVESQPHPGVVREVLRDLAPELGLVEEPDGTFVPVSEKPITASAVSVDRFPHQLSEVLEGLLVERYGRGWSDGDSGDRLRGAIRDFKRRYLDQRPVTYDEETALGYAIYHLPAYYAAFQYVFAELAGDGLLDARLRVLDVGAGVGSCGLALNAFCPGEALIEYHALEPAPARQILNRFLETTGRNFHTSVRETKVESFDADGPYDLLCFGSVLSELEDPVSVLLDLIDGLAADGTILALAPADRNTATHLREFERAAERDAGVTVYAPTVRLWPDERPESECWSFTQQEGIETPGFQERLDRGERGDGPTGPGGEDRRPGDGEFVNTDVQYAYTLLRTDGKRKIEFSADSTRVGKMREMDSHVTDRIDCVGVKLSHDLADDGNPLFLVGDGSERVDNFAVLADHSVLNRDLETAAYGDLLFLENVLVLWNDDEAAFNLVVDGESVVDRVPA